MNNSDLPVHIYWAEARREVIALWIHTIAQWNTIHPGSQKSPDWLRFDHRRYPLEDHLHRCLQTPPQASPPLSTTPISILRSANVLYGQWRIIISTWCSVSTKNAIMNSAFKMSFVTLRKRSRAGSGVRFFLLTLAASQRIWRSPKGYRFMTLTIYLLVN